MPDKKIPPEPNETDLESLVSPLIELSAQIHEMFVSYVSVGFTEWQACRIIGVWLAELGRQQ